MIYKNFSYAIYNKEEAEDAIQEAHTQEGPVLLDLNTGDIYVYSNPYQKELLPNEDNFIKLPSANIDEYYAIEDYRIEFLKSLLTITSDLYKDVKKKEREVQRAEQEKYWD